MLQREHNPNGNDTKQIPRRFDEAFEREVAALANKPGAKQEQVARDPGVSASSVARWKKRSGATPSASVPGVSGSELARRIKALERENADLRGQRPISKKGRRHLLRTPAMMSGVIRQLAGQHAYRELLRSHGVILSLSRAGNGCDKAQMERFWATMKIELIDGHIYATRAAAKSTVLSYIEVFYNRTRLHGALGFYSPLDFENQLN